MFFSQQSLRTREFGNILECDTLDHNRLARSLGVFRVHLDRADRLVYLDIPARCVVGDEFVLVNYRHELLGQTTVVSLDAGYPYEGADHALIVRRAVVQWTWLNCLFEQTTILDTMYHKGFDDFFGVIKFKKGFKSMLN